MPKQTQWAPDYPRDHGDHRGPDRDGSRPRPIFARRLDHTVSASSMRDPPRVLIVEDDPRVAGGIVRGLRGAGFEVELATDGISGTRKVFERTFDAVVLDLMLPGQSGMDVLEQLKGRRSIPIIVL